MGKQKSKIFPLLELIDLHERAKEVSERDWGSNAHAEPIFTDLGVSCELSYGGRFKNLHYCKKISFIYHYN
ncbi:MAG: hypothetical protein EOP45_13225 [Sphingobacteriaceae bacterium]|nr:MAG: hypothetical protein EOP45_13225 [Sphingobacteriaceae bacterium]